MDNALQACSFFLARLKDEVARLSEITYPGHHTGPKIWLAVVGGVIDTAAGYLDQANADPKPANASALVRDAERLGNTAYELLKHMAGSDATEIPHQIVGPFQRWVDGLGITDSIFFRADHVPNYELATVDLRSFIRNINSPSRSLLDARDAVNWPFRRVTVPSHAMGMLPHFAIVAHELGHAIQDQIKLDLTSHVSVEASSLAKTEARITGKGSTFMMEHRIRRAKIFASWVNELKSDALGYYIAGPALFFALGAFLELAGQGWGLGDTHPPSELRRKLLFDKLEEGTPSFSAVLQKHTALKLTVDVNSPHIDSLPPPDDLFNALSATMGVADAAICVELIPLVEAIAPDIYDGARTVVAGHSAAMIYEPANLDDDLSDHLDALCGLVPPIESRNGDIVKPATLAGILNVGWATLITRLDQIRFDPQGPPGGRAAKKMEMLNELLLKAVELSEARRLWEEH